MGQDIKLIVGFHACTPEPPKIASLNGLVNRVAFAIESYREEAIDMFFDAPLFLKLINAVSAITPHDQTEVIEIVAGTFFQRLLRRQHQKNVGSIDILQKFLKEKNEPPSQIRWLKATVPVVVGMSENWYRVGGPEPYHDTYTFSLFASGSIKDLLVKTLISVADLNGAGCKVIYAERH